jgi:hypothetical protein
LKLFAVPVKNHDRHGKPLKPARDRVFEGRGLFAYNLPRSLEGSEQAPRHIGMRLLSLYRKPNADVLRRACWVWSIACNIALDEPFSVLLDDGAANESHGVDFLL